MSQSESALLLARASSSQWVPADALREALFQVVTDLARQGATPADILRMRIFAPEPLLTKRQTKQKVKVGRLFAEQTQQESGGTRVIGLRHQGLGFGATPAHSPGECPYAGESRVHGSVAVRGQFSGRIAPRRLPQKGFSGHHHRLPRWI
jgi:hypothetical protein